MNTRGTDCDGVDVRRGFGLTQDWSGNRRERSRSREARRASGYTDIRPEPRKVSPRRRSEYKVESGKGKSTISGKRAPVTARAAARAQGDDDAPDTRSAPDPRHDAKKPRTVADVGALVWHGSTALCAHGLFFLHFLSA